MQNSNRCFYQTLKNSIYNYILIIMSFVIQCNYAVFPMSLNSFILPPFTVVPFFKDISTTNFFTGK